MAYGLEQGEDGRWIEGVRRVPLRRCELGHGGRTAVPAIARSIVAHPVGQGAEQAAAHSAGAINLVTGQYLAHCRDVTTVLREIVQRHVTRDDPTMPERSATNGLEVDVE